MATRRRPTPSTAADDDDDDGAATAPSLAEQAMRASAAHRDSSLFGAYAEPAASSRRQEPLRSPPAPVPPQGSYAHEYTSLKNLNESKYGFWGTLARKAKALVDEDGEAFQDGMPGERQPQVYGTSLRKEHSQSTAGMYRENDTPTSQRSSDAFASSLNYLGGTIKSALEEGRTLVGNKTANIIQETRKLNFRRKGSSSSSQGELAERRTPRDFPQPQFDHETQLKAARDVANAMAAKAKLLLRELKTVKADLAFSKERCAQLEEENKFLRESRDKGDNPDDDDLIRLQLETLLAEKARLTHENSVYARENRFLREIVEYHQLKMQDVIYVDEGIEEVTEVYPTHILPPTASHMPPPRSISMPGGAS